jgi:hypothetical protein
MPGTSSNLAGLDHFPPELRKLSVTAAEVLDTHLNTDGRCGLCGTSWPCERVQLAEHNLAAI